MNEQTHGRRTLFAISMIGLCGATSCGPKSPGVEGPGPVSSACTLPTAMAESNEQTAWQLFVAASCGVDGKLAWETWTEQTCLEHPDRPGCSPGAAPATKVRHFHGSRLGERLRKDAAKATAAGATPGGCNAMVTAANAPPKLAPFVPSNLATNAQFCEEVFVDPTEAAFVRAPASGATLTTLTGQVAYGQAQAITFPTSAVEIKADWLPAASVNNQFDCTTNRPAGVYVATISGVCYALVGIHVSSKLLPNWLWATFEPQSRITNPNRCNPDLYNACNDPWGSSPATSTGQDTKPTPALAALMSEAGIAKEFLNYRLVGAQSTYVDGNDNPIQLGNSFVEFNAGVLPHEASCITCHSYAMVSTVAQENPNFGNFPGTPPIGTPGQAPLPAQGGGTWVAQDFSWMLGIMPTK
jgi:hypothetical protein